MARDPNKVIDLSFDALTNETDKAWCLDIDGETYWFPKSQCELYESDKVIVVPDWLVKEKGL